MSAKAAEQRTTRNIASPSASHFGLGVAIFSVIAWIIFWPAVHGAFLYDDSALVAHNPVIQAPDGLFRIWFTRQTIDYWPVFNTALWLQWRLWGADTTGYHIVNILLHLCNAALIWLLFDRLGLMGGILAALLFLIHPANVESVAWIAQLKGLLAMFFLLLATFAYVHSEERNCRRPTAWYGVATGLFALSMLSKASAVYFPILVIAMLRWSRPLTRRDWWRIAPWVGIAIALTLVNAWFRSRFSVELPGSQSIVTRVLEANAALWFYAYKALLPLQLSFLYPKWRVEPQSLWWWMWLLASLVVALTGWRLRRQAVVLALVVFVLSLAPPLALTLTSQMREFSVADHYLYQALPAVAGMLASAWATWRRDSVIRRRLVDSSVIVICTALAVLSRQQSANYQDAIAVYEASLRTSPTSALAHHNLGLAYSTAGRFVEARKEFERALQLKPDYDQAEYSLGLVLADSEGLAAAIPRFRRAVMLAPDSSAYHYRLGVALLQSELPKDATTELEAAVRLEPRHAQGFNDLGAALQRSGRLDDATQAFQSAVDLDPGLVSARHNLALARLTSGAVKAAIIQFREALRLSPGDATVHSDFAVALAQSGDRESAIEELRHALQLDPTNVQARDNLQELLATAPQRSPP